MKFLYLLYKDFLLILKSKFILIMGAILVIYYFLTKFMVDTRFKMQINAPINISEKIKYFVDNYYSGKIVITENEPDLVVNIDLQSNYWIVNVKVNKFNSLKFVPFVNLMFYKIYFSEKGLVDPIKFNVYYEDYNIDIFSKMMLGFALWSLFSFVSSEIYREKMKKTALIFDDVNMLILSKSFSSTLLLLLIIGVYTLIFGFSNGLIMILFLFLFASYIYGVLSWVIKNYHLFSFINFFFGLMFVLGPIFGDFKFEPYFIFLIVSLFLVIYIVVKRNNKEMQKVVWE